MTTRLEWCDCRWCFDEHPGGLVLFVTLPSNKYALRGPTSGMRAEWQKIQARRTAELQWSIDHKDTPEEVKQLLREKLAEVKAETYEGALEEEAARDRVKENHTFGRLMIPPGGFDGRDIDDVVERRIPWACDNGSFNVFDQPRFEAMMDRLADRPFCHFVAAPDVVWNKYPPHERHLSAIATIEKYELWHQYIRDRGLPAAMVGQDGLENYEIPWEHMDAYFVGGSDAWKTSVASEKIIKEALRRGLWVHVGRVSSNDRIRWCRAVGASSFDGSAFGRFRDAQDKNDGLGRLQAGLLNAGALEEERLFEPEHSTFTDLYAASNGREDLTPSKEKESSQPS